MSKEEQQLLGANKRTVWTVATAPFKEAHFATFPPALIVDCIKAGCPPGGVVGDMFMGARTTAVVAQGLGMHYAGCEISPAYNAIGERRQAAAFGMFHNSTPKE